MKRYNLRAKLYGALTAIVLLGMTGCDPLGIEPTTEVGEEQFWSNPQLARTYVNTFYTWRPATANQYFTSEQWSDNAIGNDEKDWKSYNQKSFTHRWYDAVSGIDGFSAPWSEQYKKVRAINLGLEKIGPSELIDEASKNQYLGECYFFRAWVYFELEQYWGPVPFVDKVLNITDETMIPRSTREELFDYILKDLDSAIECFGKSGITPTLGLVNVDAAQVFKSRVALYAACAAEASKAGTYEGLNAEDNSKALFRFTKEARTYYQMAFDAAKTVFGKYSLDDYEKLFNKENAHTSPEAIWPLMINKDIINGFNPAAANGPDGYYYGASQKFSPSWDCRGSVFPTQDLVDCYYQLDEADNQWKQWWKTKQARDMGILVDAEGNMKGTSADYVSKLYGNRDKRFYVTVAYDGSYLGPEEEMYLIGTWIDNSEPAESERYSALHTGFRNTIRLQAPADRSSAQTITGYYPRKYMALRFHEDGTMNKEQPPITFFMIRYAEALLNYAEAALKLGQDGEALAKVNDIRRRAGLSDFNAAVVGHGLWEEYKLQRRIEFAYEVPGHRYYDLLRWNEAAGNSTIAELNRAPRGMLIFRKGIESNELGKNGYPAPDTDPKYFVPYFETRALSYDAWLKKFDNARYYFMPFPETLMTSYRGFIQNPGWQNFVYER